MNVADRLRTLLGDLGLRPNAAPLPEPSLRHAPETEHTEPLPFDRLGGLRRLHTEHGPVDLVESLLPADQPVGRAVPTASHLWDLAPLDRLLRDPRLGRLRVRDALFLDIEATDLFAGAGCQAFLIGLGFFRRGGDLVVQQVLQRDPGSEEAGLHYLMEMMERYPLLVSFNGKSYDLSVLQNRLVISGICSSEDASLKLEPHVDLLHTSRRIWAGCLDDSRLRTLETEVLGFHRRDDLPGALAPEHYFAWLHSQDARWLQPVLRHNLHDVRSLAALLGVSLEGLRRPGSCTHPGTMLNLGRWLWERGALERGRQILLQALEGPLPTHRRAEAYRWSFRAERRAADPPGQVRVLRRWCRDLPEDPEPWIAWAKLCEHALGDPEAALRAAVEARRRLDPDDLGGRLALDHRLRRLSLRLRRLHRRAGANKRVANATSL